MKIAIIGCGNMGGAIARGLAADAVFASEHTIAASNRTQPKLDAIKAEYPQIETSTDNCQAAAAVRHHRYDAERQAPHRAQPHR